MIFNNKYSDDRQYNGMIMEKNIKLYNVGVRTISDANVIIFNRSERNRSRDNYCVGTYSFR